MKGKIIWGIVLIALAQEFTFIRLSAQVFAPENFTWEQPVKNHPDLGSFCLLVTNNYVKTTNVLVQVNCAGSVPGYVAVSVDDTNFAATTHWQAFNGSNIVANLGRKNGWHEVWVGLCNLTSNQTAAWQCQRLNLIQLQPLLVVTDPPGKVTSQPVIQLRGYCREPLASLNYDLRNAAGAVSNLPAEITEQYYDTGIGEFTTNFFECLDVPLTNGFNTITIHATDLAGNTTNASISYVLDYSAKTNAPAMQITWPQSMAQISGSNFTCRGVLDDPTATVTTQLVFTNSNARELLEKNYTNTYVAAVERNGNFWLENLPLYPGTNTFAIHTTDAAGNTSLTNLSVVQSSLILTVNPVAPDAQLWQPAVDLTGKISDPNYALWVNGVKGRYDGHGAWSARQVPVNKSGPASFTVTAYGPTEPQPDGSPANAAIQYAFDQEKPPRLIIQSFSAADKFQRETKGTGNLAAFAPVNRSDSQPVPVTSDFFWSDAVSRQNFNLNETKITVKLQTGGKPSSRLRNLLALTCSTARLPGEVIGGTTQFDHNGCFLYKPATLAAAASQRISLGAFGNLNTNGMKYLILPDNIEVDVTPKLGGLEEFSFCFGTSQKYHSYFDVFVTQANPLKGWPFETRNVGHAWYGLRTDAPTNALPFLLSAGNYSVLTCRGLTGRQIPGNFGYYPSNDLFAPYICSGILVVPEYHRPADAAIKKSFYIGFDDFAKGLEFTRKFHSNPGTFLLVGNNCVSMVRKAFEAVGGSPFCLPQGNLPQYFGYDLLVKYSKSDADINMPY